VSRLHLIRAKLSFSSRVAYRHKTTVTVVKANHLVLGPQILKFESINQLVVRVPIHVFAFENGPKLLDGPRINHNMVLHCELIHSNKLDLVTYISVSKDDPVKYCAVHYSHDISLLISGLSQQPVIRATISDKAKSYTLEGTRPISFLPIFNINTKLLRLSNAKPEAYIQVVWYRKETAEEPENPQLVIEVNKDVLNVHKIRPGDPMWVGQVAKANASTDFYRFSLKLEEGIRTSFLNERVVFLNPETGQRIPVLVSYESELGEDGRVSPPTRQQGSSWGSFFLAIFIIVMIGAIVCLVNYCQSPPTVVQTGGFAPLLVSSQHGASPQTPLVNSAYRAPGRGYTGQNYSSPYQQLHQ